MRYIKTYEETTLSLKDDAVLVILKNAILKSNVELVKHIINSGFDIKKYSVIIFDVLRVKMNSNDKEIFKILVDAGVDVNIQNKYGITPLFTSIYGSKIHLDVIKYLIANGADVNFSKNNIPLSHSILSNLGRDNFKIQLNILREFIKNGMNFYDKDNNGQDFFDRLNISYYSDKKEEILNIVKEEAPEVYRNYEMREEAKKYNL